MTGRQLLNRLKHLTDEELEATVIFANFENGDLKPALYGEVSHFHYTDEEWESEFGNVIVLEKHIEY